MIKKEKKHSMRKEKLTKVGYCFISGCFIKPFKMIIFLLFLKLFYFSSLTLYAAQFCLFDIRNIKRGNCERQIARNGKLHIFFKSNFNLLVMNVTQLNFLYWQNVHIWHFIKVVNHKRSFLFVVVSTLISWSKTKFFTIKYKLKMWKFT